MNLRHITILLLGLLCVAVKAQNTNNNTSPYTFIGDQTKILEATYDTTTSKHFDVIGVLSSGKMVKAKFNFRNRTVSLEDYNGNIISIDTLSVDSKAFTTIDPHAENYYHLSPYNYCGGSPVNAIDPNGMDIYMLFYTTGNGRGDEMFKSAAETRKYDIEHSDFYDAANDIVLMCGIQDISIIGSLVSSAVESYGDIFGKTAEFSIWSHAGKDGPTGTIRTSHNALDGKQMTLEGWGNIDFNWASGATANFYGCKTGVGDYSNPSFSTRISSLNNYRDVSVHGQTSSAYPSNYTNIRQNNQEMINGVFSYPTYMVGGASLGIVGHFFPTSTRANPMRTSRNGKGVVDRYYQPGIRR
ncbi:hypothetical protein [Prevotella sp. OH937_COT-195]|uniref:hypothetical protein n=1 Tax=Prevotella sp. OH937_COT-195 TaxID=2491051 RepID=UPI000F648BD6|nr:hypothetical protein [Prevotella sp. OH937_COT-195]RRC99108.1 hypothetical protein EII32_08180 [Prevotella sp. OH937_COT-195]